MAGFRTETAARRVQAGLPRSLHYVLPTPPRAAIIG